VSFSAVPYSRIISGGFQLMVMMVSRGRCEDGPRQNIDKDGQNHKEYKEQAQACSAV
jgi:hypothetical protein